jgi:predicted class III extradiol MEMO1 family dioxygenase
MMTSRQLAIFTLLCGKVPVSTPMPTIVRVATMLEREGYTAGDVAAHIEEHGIDVPMPRLSTRKSEVSS